MNRLEYLWDWQVREDPYAVAPATFVHQWFNLAGNESYEQREESVVGFLTAQLFELWNDTFDLWKKYVQQLYCLLTLWFCLAQTQLIFSHRAGLFALASRWSIVLELARHRVILKVKQL